MTPATESIQDEELTMVRTLVREGIRARRQAIVYSLARRFLSVIDSFAGIEAPRAVAHATTGWTRIESLSQLRAVVGGRFQNLKQKWVSAGFPLRDHRGDREAKAVVDDSGWIELSVWVGKQGFETRLAAEHEPWLFEVRKL